MGSPTPVAENLPGPSAQEPCPTCLHGEGGRAQGGARQPPPLRARGRRRGSTGSRDAGHTRAPDRSHRAPRPQRSSLACKPSRGPWCGCLAPGSAWSLAGLALSPHRPHPIPGLRARRGGGRREEGGATGPAERASVPAQDAALEVGTTPAYKALSRHRDQTPGILMSAPQ